MSFDIPHLTEIALDDLEALGTGAGTLDTGGNGSPRLGRPQLQMLLEDDAYPDSIRLVNPRDLPPDATAASVGGVGTPTINVEKFAGGDEEVQSLRTIEELSSEMVDALIPGEVSGMNSIAPLRVATVTDLPMINADGMGRVFPEPRTDMFFVCGTPVDYTATTDEYGNQVVYRDTGSAKHLENLTRVITVQVGGRLGYVFPLMTGVFVLEYAVLHAASLAIEFGRAVERARDAGADPVDADRELSGGEELFAGKIVDMHHRNHDGFALRSVTLAGLGEDATLEIEFQSESLVTRDDDGDLRMIMPDLICLVDTDTGVPVTTDALRYGQRVRVLGVPASELLTAPEVLDVIGPGAFGYEVPYDPLSRNEAGW